MIFSKNDITKKEKDRNIFLKRIVTGGILVFHFFVLLVNAIEDFNIMNINSNNLNGRQVSVMKSRRMRIHSSILLITFNIFIVMVSSMTPIPSFLEIKLSKLISYYKTTFGLSYNLHLEGVAFISTITMAIFLVKFIIIWCVRKTTPTFLFTEFITYPLLSFAILNLIGDHPTFNNILKMGAAITCTIFTLFGINISGDIRGVNKTIIAYTVKFNTIAEEFLKDVGKYRRFKNIYLKSSELPSFEYSTGLFWNQNIYITLLSSNNLTKKELLGVLMHEAGHCYYTHRTRTFLVGLFLNLFYVAVGGYFVLKSNFVDNFVKSKNLGAERGEKVPAKASIAMKLIVFYFILLPVFEMTSMSILNILYRYNELQADGFAVNMGYRDKLLAYCEKDTDYYIKSGWKIYSLLFDTHPWMPERIQNLKTLKERNIT